MGQSRVGAMLSQSPETLVLIERVAGYRALADDTLQSAAMTFDRNIRNELLSLAAAWCGLADELAKTIDGTRTARETGSAIDRANSIPN